MKKLLLLTALVFTAAAPARATYLGTIVQDPANLHLSAGLGFNSAFKLNGGDTQAAIIYHDANPDESLIPKKVQALGIKPISWAVSVGLGGSRGNFVVPFGFSANLLPTVLGPALDALKGSGNSTAAGFASMLDGPNGGVSFGPQWTTHGMEDGTILPFNRWRFPPGWRVGALWRFH